jgi:hypothetical protein
MVRRMGRLAALVAFEAAALGLLLSMHEATVDWTHLTAWAQTVTSEDALAAASRLVAIGCSLWLAVTTCLCAVASIAGCGGAVARRVTLPLVKRIVEDVVVIGLVGTISSVAAPAFAGQDSAATAGKRPHPAEAPRLVPPGMASIGWSSTGARALEADRRVVVSGNSLWSIAAEAAREADPAASPGAIASYWRSVIAENRDRLRSGDPDLIFPGEVVVMPPIGRDA